MKTRLDEIVEEFPREGVSETWWLEWGRCSAKLVAVAAFRHGVEREREEARKVRDRHCDDPMPEPAHVEEKRKCGYCGVRDADPRVGCCAECMMNERRKGERRRPDPPPRRGFVDEVIGGMEIRRPVVSYNTVGPQTHWCTDRRSGKDRRSAK